MAEDHSGHLSKAEFVKVATNLGLNEKQARQLFASLDKSQDKTITISEIMEAHERLAHAAHADTGTGAASKSLFKADLKETKLDFVLSYLCGFMWRVPPDVTDTRVKKQVMTLAACQDRKRSLVKQRASFAYTPGKVELDSHCEEIEAVLIAKADAIVRSLGDLQDNLKQVALKRRELGATMRRELAAHWQVVSHHDALAAQLWTAVESAFVRLEPFSKSEEKEQSWDKFAPQKGVARRVKWASWLVMPLMLILTFWYQPPITTPHPLLAALSPLSPLASPCCPCTSRGTVGHMQSQVHHALPKDPQPKRFHGLRS